MNNTKEALDSLIYLLAALPQVKAIGSPGKELPRPGEGDIDLFIYCESIPEEHQREAILNDLPSIDNSAIGVYDGGHWGVGDYASLQGVDTSLMFFTIAETEAEIKSLLAGTRLDRENNYYYPLGRCAMLQSIRELYDEADVFTRFKSLLNEYPSDLSKTIVGYHLDKLEDVEDLLRAVARKDVLFYHFAIELALDSFLQALFAYNKVFFPSRKRSLEYMRRFAYKPQDCEQRLLDMLCFAGQAESLQQSYSFWLTLVNDLKLLCE